MRKKRSRRRLLNSLALLLTTAIIGYYLVNIDSNRISLLTAGQPLAARDTTPDSYSGNVKIRKFGITGELSHTLDAAQIDFYETGKNREQDSVFMLIELDDTGNSKDPSSEGDYATIRKPEFNIYDKEKITFALSANSARLLNNGEDIELIDDVLVNDIGNATAITTSELLVSTVLKQVFTEKPVNIVTPSSSTSAVGLHGKLARKEWQLVSEVNSVVQP